MNNVALRRVALLAAAAVLLAGPAGAATKTTKKAAKAKVTTKTTAKAAATTTAAPSTTAAASTTAPVTTAAVKAPTGTPIKIGVISAETGTNSSAYYTTPIVAQAWAKWVNAEKGGVAGHPVEVLTADDLNTPAGAQVAARDLIESKGAVGLLLQDSTAESALVSYADTNRVPVIGGSANNAAAGVGHGVSVNYFMTASGGPASGESPVVIANAIGARPYTAVVCAEVAACAAGAKQAEDKAKALGVPYSGVLTVAGASPNFTAECLEVMARVASSGRTSGFVSMGVAPSTLIRVVRDCNRQGFKGIYGASNQVANGPAFEQIDAAGDFNVAGAINGFPWWSDAAPVKEFRDVMAKNAPKLDFRDPTSTSTWATLELFRKAMATTTAATVTKDDVYKAYWSLKDETLNGLLPKAVTYTQGRPSPLLNCYWPFTFKEGKFASLVIDRASTGNGQTGDLRTYCG